LLPIHLLDATGGPVDLSCIYLPSPSLFTSPFQPVFTGMIVAQNSSLLCLTLFPPLPLQLEHQLQSLNSEQLETRVQNERLRHLNENLLEELEKSKWELEVVKGQLQKLQKEAQLEQEQKDRWEWAGEGVSGQGPRQERKGRQVTEE